MNMNLMAVLSSEDETGTRAAKLNTSAQEWILKVHCGIWIHDLSIGRLTRYH